jgi:hypothetical protein
VKKVPKLRLDFTAEYAFIEGIYSEVFDHRSSIAKFEGLIGQARYYGVWGIEWEGF